jgi:ribosomal protein S18 acetylase RimI-like enzyme
LTGSKSRRGRHAAIQSQLLDGASVRLRPVRDGETLVDSTSVWDDWGPRDAPPPDDVERLVVEVGGVSAGSVSWHSVSYGPNTGSRAFNVGIGLAVEFRGRGVGTIAQRLLVEHLFGRTAVRRIEASTDVENHAEQRALEKVGFQREGILRQSQYRADGWHDMVSYSILREDLDPPD